MSPKALEQVIYFAAYVVIDPGNIPVLEYKQVINDKELREITYALIFTAMAFPVLHRSENTLAEQAVFFRFLRSVVYGFGLGARR